jgi:hypothetical protein
MGAENVAITGIRSTDRSARSESVYRLSYHGPFLYSNLCIFLHVVCTRKEELIKCAVRNPGYGVVTLAPLYKMKS